MNGFGGSVPLIFVLVLLLFVAGGIALRGFLLKVLVQEAWQIINGRRQRPLDRCTSCGYDLTGNVSGVCPECGQSGRGGR